MLKVDGKSVGELRKLAEEGVVLADYIKGKKITVDWPHKPPVITGDVRQRLIHEKMHKKEDTAAVDRNMGSKLNFMSFVFVIFVTVPAVSFSLHTLFKWMEMEETKARTYSLIGGLASFFVEVLLMVIQEHRKEQRVNIGC